VLASVALTVGGVAEARRDRTVLGDAIRASRMIASLRIDEAEPLIADLTRRAPDAPPATAHRLWHAHHQAAPLERRGHRRGDAR